MGLFGSTKVKSKTTQYLPSWLEDKSKAAVEEYFDAANRDYPTYDGTRVAEFTPQQQQAFGLASERVGQWQPALDLATNTVADTLQRDWPSSVDQYMNPYVENVTSGVLRRMNESYDTQKKQMEGKAASLGALFQPNYVNQVQQNAFERQQLQLQDAIDKGYYDAYDKAFQAYMKDALVRQQGVETLSGLAGQEAVLSQGDISSLLGVGGQQQAREQALADIAYQEHMAEFNYPQQQMAQLVNFLNAAPYTKITKGTQTQSTSPGIIDWITLPASIYGAYETALSGGQQPSNSTQQPTPNTGNGSGGGGGTLMKMLASIFG